MTDPTGRTAEPEVWCQICGHAGVPAPRDLGRVRGNTRRYKEQMFRLWKCPQCASIYSLDPVDFDDIYDGYPLGKRRLDVYARSTLANLTRRLERAGMVRGHAILDYGCGNGLYLEYLRRRGYRRVLGYDPFVPEFASLPAAAAPFDVVVNNDTLEHCDDVRAAIQHCVDLLAPGGILYLGTADSEPVDMADLEPHVMCLHQPYHRVMITAVTLARLTDEVGLEPVASYRRSYQDTLRPFANYRFLDELNRALGHDLDRALDPAQSTPAFLRSPRLWFFALAGYLFPSAWEPAIVLRKP